MDCEHLLGIEKRHPPKMNALSKIKLKKSGIKKIIVVDDYSSDGTRRIPKDAGRNAAVVYS